MYVQHDYKNWVWPTFGCKLGQNDPIVMKLKLDMSCHLQNAYTKFHIDTWKHVDKKSEKCWEKNQFFYGDLIDCHWACTTMTDGTEDE